MFPLPLSKSVIGKRRTSNNCFPMYECVVCRFLLNLQYKLLSSRLIMSQKKNYDIMLAEILLFTIVM